MCKGGGGGGGGGGGEESRIESEGSLMVGTDKSNKSRVIPITTTCSAMLYVL